MSTVRVMRPMGSDAGSGLASAIAQFGESMDPSREMRARAQASNARYDDARTAGLTRAADAHQLMSEFLGNGGQVGPKLYGIAALGGPEMMQRAPAFARGYASAIPGATPDSMSMPMLGAGDTFQSTPMGAREGMANQLRQSAISAGPGYAGVAERRRQFDGEGVTMFDGAGNPVLVPRSQVEARQGDGYRPPVTLGQMQGQAAAGAMRPGADLLVPGITNPAVILAPSQAVGTMRDDMRADNQVVMVQRGAGPPIPVPRGEMQPGDVPLGVQGTYRPPAAATTPRPAVINAAETARTREAIQARLTQRSVPATPEQIDTLLAEVNRRRQITGDPASAMEQVFSELVTNGTSGWWNGTSGSIRPRDAVPATGAQGVGSGNGTGQQQAPNGTTRLQQMGVPAPAERRAGQTYDIPGRGPMVWTGTGWRPGS